MSYNKVPPDPSGGGGGGGSVNSVNITGTGLVLTGTASDPILATSAATNTSLGKADTALQPAGNLTGTVNGVAVATVTAGAALGATAVQPATSPTLSGLIVANGSNATIAVSDAASYIALRGTPATAGQLRCTNNSGLVSRNAGNTANIRIAQVDASDQLLFGPFMVAGDALPANVVYDVDAAGTHKKNVNGATILTIAATLVTIAAAASLRVSSLGAGVGHYDGSGNLTSSTVVNADVSATAAIAGTKISPNFGSQAILTTGTLGAGASTVSSLRVTALGAGIGHYDGSGNLTSSTVVNADVDAAAAIAGTKISPDFGSQNIVTTGVCSLGTTPATAGTLRIPHGGTIQGRNSTNAADRVLVDWGATTTDTLILGNAGATTRVNATSNQLFLQTNSVSRITIQDTTILLGSGVINMQWPSTAASVNVNQATDNTATFTGKTFTLNAQDCSGTTTVTAGNFTLRAGDATGASGTRNGGAFTIRPGNGATAQGALDLQNGAGTSRIKVNGTGIGFFAVTPVGQSTDMVALTDSTTGTPATTLVDVGVAFSQANINNNFSSLLTQVNKLRTHERAFGLMA